jgi:hypothetical protein
VQVGGSLPSNLRVAADLAWSSFECVCPNVAANITEVTDLTCTLTTTGPSFTWFFIEATGAAPVRSPCYRVTALPDTAANFSRHFVAGDLCHRV